MPPGETLEQRWYRLISGESRGLAPWLGRLGLTLLSGLYWFGLNCNLCVYILGLRRQTQPRLPVISVGNLSVGGAGKSTAVRFIARELLARGLRPGVVLRGHRREDASEVVLASDGAGWVAPLRQTGDEAAELARALPAVPVAVGKRREEAIELLATAGAQVAILDDGFQYFRMARELDLVLVSARMSPQAARLLPRGVLREPWSHLRRADQVWLTHVDQAAPAQLAAMRAAVVRVAPHKPLVTACHAVSELITLQGAPVALETLQKRTVVALSGVGSPETFEAAVEALGAVVKPLRFDDHHHYEPEDWEQVAEIAERAGAGVVVTTEKDAVKLPPGAPLPVWVLRSELRLVSGLDVVSRGLDRLVEKLSR